MPYPVPPAPPTIVQSLQPENIPPIATNAPAPLSTTQPATANTLSPPKPFPQNIAKSAELLGPSVWIGYPIKPVATKNSSDNSAIDAPTAPPASAQQFSSSGRSASSAKPNVGSSPDEEVESELTLSSPEATRSLSTDFSDTSLPLTSAPERASPASPASPALFSFRLTVVEPRPATLSILAQQQRQPVVQPTPPASSLVTPKPLSQPPGQNPPPVRERIIELTSQRQEYDVQRHIVTAEGNVVLRIEGAVVTANRLQANLQNLIAVGEGNVVVTRGQQVLRGQRLTYNFVQNNGEILYARGDVDLPATRTDFSDALPTDVTTGGVLQQPPDQRALLDQPLQQVTSPGGIGIRVGPSRYVNPASRPQRGGTIRRLRFQAERINFYPGGWQATNVQLTNDPFSPPELELRADTATLTQQNSTQSQLVTTRPHLVFDQGFTLPVPKREATLGRGQRRTNTFPLQLSIDSTDKGGLYIQRGFTPISTDRITLSVAPQFLVERAVSSGSNNRGAGSLFGLGARLNGNLGPRTQLSGSASVNGLDSFDIQNRVRASLRLRQLFGNLNLPYTLTLESSYRDRLFNGSLGYQTVQSSLGGVLTSPAIALGNGFFLSYQVGAQDVLADTDRLSLLSPTRTNNRVSLGRFQGTAALSRGFLLFSGKGLPATATQGLRYSSVPVVPYLVAFGGLQGVSTYYTSGDSQNSLTASVGLAGQLGHFSRSYLDYSGFNLTFSQGVVNGLSPFLFDRFVDNKILAAGLTQQIYGPIRLEVQTILNLDTGKEISTDYILEYSRRTYGISLRYNPVLGLGSINIRISGFNYVGGTNAFSGSDVLPVVNGVQRENY